MSPATPTVAETDAIDSVRCMGDPRASDAVAVLEERLAGRTLAKVVAHGINTLKTVDPPLGAITDVSVDAVALGGDTTVEIAAGPFLLRIDLQRSGRIQLDDLGREWAPGQRSMPTIQLIFDDGLVANFAEPGKTKRITLRVSTRT